MASDPLRRPRTAAGAAFVLALLAGCSPAADQQPQQNTAEAPKERPPHCFFKDSELDRWALKVANGKAEVTGRAFRSDPRYKAVLLEPKIAGGVAEIRPSISNNDTGFAAEGNWWDLKAEVPAAGIDKVEVRCGEKLVASLPVSG